MTFAAEGVARAVDRNLGRDERLFFYLPFEHSEDLADQELSVLLFETLDDAEWLDYAVRHRDVIAQFGRFPHRNESLERKNTTKESNFLAQPGSRFGDQTPKNS